MFSGVQSFAIAPAQLYTQQGRSQTNQLSLTQKISLWFYGRDREFVAYVGQNWENSTG
uniref:hypothetical protein n=1 Tax=Trichocoleus desertorum TaxID=1481672 RepID=UPI0025B3ACAC|nr:hypothetical protein [Trichocoleus desertorum]